MKNYLKALLLLIFATFFIWLLWFLIRDHPIAILQPKGLIAQAELNLIAIATILMLTIVLPVFVLTAIIAWRYRANNTKAKYLPNWEHNVLEEFVWWVVPCLIIIVLASLAWKTSFELDPFRPIQGETEVIQVVALNWKWLFIYPKEKIASVNFVEFPAGKPVSFRITSDAPMNAFWIPQLGGQVYAMTGMVTQLQLIANEPGSYRGSSANISGKGFSGMKFIAKAVSTAEFDAWVASIQKNTTTLDAKEYALLATPSANVSPLYFGGVQEGLFDRIVLHYEASMPMNMHHDDD